LGEKREGFAFGAARGFISAPVSGCPTMIACCNLLPGLAASTHLPRLRVRRLRARGPARPAQVLAKLGGRGGEVDEKGTSIGWNISKRTFRAMIDSALGLDPDDNSEEAKAKRRLRGRADFDGIAFVAKIAVEPNNHPRYQDPRHDPPMERRSVRLSAPMERGACAHGQRATRHAPRDRHGRGHLPHGVASSLSKLSRDRLQGVHPDLVRVVERTIQITLEDSMIASFSR
jgi:hypothetical protein